MKEGQEDRDIATTGFTLGSNGKMCDVNGDGRVDVANITSLIKMIAGQE